MCTFGVTGHNQVYVSKNTPIHPKIPQNTPQKQCFWGPKTLKTRKTPKTDLWDLTFNPILRSYPYYGFWGVLGVPKTMIFGVLSILTPPITIRDHFGGAGSSITNDHPPKRPFGPPQISYTGRFWGITPKNPKNPKIMKMTKMTKMVIFDHLGGIPPNDDFGVPI